MKSEDIDKTIETLTAYGKDEIPHDLMTRAEVAAMYVATIEALRTERDRAYAAGMTKAAEIAAAIEALKRDRDALLLGDREECRLLTAERDRLRAALEDIIGSDAALVRSIARAALAATGGKDE